MAVTLLYEKDADMKYLKDLTVAVIGYGSQGSSSGVVYESSGVKVIIGVRGGTSFNKAKEDGFEVMDVAKAVSKTDIIHILLPDERQGEVYENG